FLRVERTTDASFDNLDRNTIDSDDIIILLDKILDNSDAFHTHHLFFFVKNVMASTTLSSAVLTFFDWDNSLSTTSSKASSTFWHSFIETPDFSETFAMTSILFIRFTSSSLCH